MKNLSRKLTVLLLAVCIVSCDSIYRVPLERDEVFSQEVALRISRDAIRQAGHDPDSFEPYPIRQEYRVDRSTRFRSSLQRDVVALIERKEFRMKGYRRWVATAALLICGVSAASGQRPSLTPAQAAPFLGTWLFDMTNPAGSRQTVRIWDKDGNLGASVQVEKSSPTDVTGIVKDGDMLVLTISHDARPQMLENGAPIWVVISLTQDGEAMQMAQMLERSQTIKRGTGRRQ